MIELTPISDYFGTLTIGQIQARNGLQIIIILLPNFVCINKETNRWESVFVYFINSVSIFLIIQTIIVAWMEVLAIVEPQVNWRTCWKVFMKCLQVYNAWNRPTAITTSWLLCFSSNPQYIAISDPVVGNRSRRSLKHFLATSKSKFIASVEKFLHAFWQSGFSRINWRSLVIYLLQSPSENTYSLIFWSISSRMIISIWLWCSTKFQLSLIIPTVRRIETRGASK